MLMAPQIKPPVHVSIKSLQRFRTDTMKGGKLLNVLALFSLPDLPGLDRLKQS